MHIEEKLEKLTAGPHRPGPSSRRKKDEGLPNRGALVGNAGSQIHAAIAGRAFAGPNGNITQYSFCSDFLPYTGYSFKESR
jgi:hypothetical protein